MKRRCLTLGIALALGMAACHAPVPPTGRWIGTYEMSPVGLPTASKLEPLALPHLATVKGTIRYWIRISQGGRKLRFKISNEFSAQPLLIADASVGLAGENLDAQEGSLRSVAFGGKQAVTVPVGGSVISDPVDLTVPDGADLVVSLFVPDGIMVPPKPTTARTNPGMGEAKDATRVERWPDGNHYGVKTLVSAVDVLADDAQGVVVALGDSITDAWVNSETGDRGWPGFLSRRLEPTGVSVVNAGINSNRVTVSGSYFAPSAVARLDRDVFSVPGITHLVLLEGINDIGMNGTEGWFGDVPIVKPEALIAGYRRIIARAHQKGIKVIGATILPFAGALYYNAEKDGVRRAVNDWIRTSGEFDGVTDLDAALRDPAHPERLKAEFDSGDHLHPNIAGHRRMAEEFDLKLFTR
ncbi:MAG TPA: SGNH/GDSL hydrolase family protein [Lacunisphaera sp.]|nr:SGNH/GDSL hydrolase family protein [Lacunisphaera sp.]